MTQLTTMLSAFGDPWIVLVLLALAVLLLEAERWWTRWRRRHGRRVGMPALVLDGLAVLIAVLCAASTLALLLRGIIAAVLFVGELLNWAGAQLRETPWILVALVAVIALVGAAIAFRRGWLRLPQRTSASGNRRRTLRDRAGISSAAADAPDSGGQPAPAAAARESGTVGVPTRQAVPTPAIAIAPSSRPQPAATPRDMPSPVPAAQLSEPVESLASLSTMSQRRRQPVAPPPQSFLASAPPASKQRRSRLPMMIVLLVIVAVAGGMLFFPQQLMDLSTGLRARISQAASPTAKRIPTSIASTPTPQPPALKRVKTDLLNVRARPGTDQEIVTTLRQGAEVLLLHDTETIEGHIWVKVRVGEQEGWVNQEFLE